jgi:hypothetical protein
MRNRLRHDHPWSWPPLVTTSWPVMTYGDEFKSRTQISWLETTAKYSTPQHHLKQTREKTVTWGSVINGVSFTVTMIILLTVISDDDNIIDCDKWHVNRFLNPCLFDCNKWHINRFLNPWLSRLPTSSQRTISYEYHPPNPLTHSDAPLPPLSWVRHSSTTVLVC